MKLLTFALKTAPLPFAAIPTVFGGAAISAATDGAYLAGVCILFAGAALFMGYLIGAASHRRTLDRINASAYVRKIIHNAKDGLPKEQVAVDYIRFIFDNPIA